MSCLLYSGLSMTLFALSIPDLRRVAFHALRRGWPGFRLCPHLFRDQGLARQRPDAGNRRRHSGRREGLPQPAGDHDQRDRRGHLHSPLHFQRPRHRRRFSRRGRLLALRRVHWNAHRGPGQYAHDAGRDQVEDRGDAHRLQWRRGHRSVGRGVGAPFGRNFLYGGGQNDRPRPRR